MCCGPLSVGVELCCAVVVMCLCVCVWVRAVVVSVVMSVVVSVVVPCLHGDALLCCGMQCCVVLCLGVVYVVLHSLCFIRCVVL